MSAFGGKADIASPEWRQRPEIHQRDEFAKKRRSISRSMLSLSFPSTPVKPK
jgi:hypothetical protein